MTGRHKFTELEAKMSPERRARIAEIAEALANEIEAPKSPSESRRRRVLELLRAHPNGLTRDQIIEKLRVQEDHEAERSILDTLHELTRTNCISAHDEKYLPA
jgi:hypothetical protein